MTAPTHAACPFCREGWVDGDWCRNCDGQGTIQVCARCGVAASLELSPTIAVCDPCFEGEGEEAKQAAG